MTMTQSAFRPIRLGKRPPPSPPGHPLLGNLPDLSGDWIGYGDEMLKRYGPVVLLRMPWPMAPFVIIGDPALVEPVFLDDAEKFRKTAVQRSVRPVLGDGLLLAEGDPWRRQRRMSQPAFLRGKIAGYAETMASLASEMVTSWKPLEVRDVYVDVSALALRITAKTLFGASMGDQVTRANDALAEVLDAFDDYFNSRLPLPLSIPTRRGRRIHRASEALTQLVYEFIDERTKSKEDRGDLLSMLLQVRDEDGSALTRLQVRDEVMNAFVAGSETTANVMAWTMYLLARAPDVTARLRDELSSVVGEGELTAGHFPSLKYMDLVIREALRLYPPVWSLGRESLDEYEVAGVTIPKGAQVNAVTYLLQRDRTYFTDPERFWPERWQNPALQKLPKFSYFPFGAGRRMCIGMGFATMELAMVLGTVFSKVRLEATTTLPTPRPSFTLRPRDGVKLRVIVDPIGPRTS